MIKSIFKRILITIVLLIAICVGIYFIPRNHTPESFRNLVHGDGFIITMLKLGKPTNTRRGGVGFRYFEYKLPDNSTVYLTFGMFLTKLDVCARYKDNEIIEVYVSNPLFP